MKEIPVFDHGLNSPASLEHNFGDHKGKLTGIIQMKKKKKGWDESSLIT